MKLRRLISPAQLVLMVLFVVSDIVSKSLIGIDPEWLEIVLIYVWAWSLFGILGATLNRFIPKHGGLIAVFGGIIYIVGVIFIVIWPDGILTSGVDFIGAGIIIGVVFHQILDRRWSRSWVR